jgi:hypothetical protein
VAADLELADLSRDTTKEVFEALIRKDPLADEMDPENPKGFVLSTGGFVCLTAYWMFASDVFDAHHDCSDIHIFPEHHLLLERFLKEEPQAQIMNNPGTVEALIVMATWLYGQDRIAKRRDGKAGGEEEKFMPYHHLLTLVSVFHPNVRTRNAATVMAGSILHAAPSEDDRLAILEDLLENCIFSSLQACAVGWLREEIISARKSDAKSRFASKEFFDTLQYTLFPDLSHLKEADPATLLETWTQNSPFYLAVANFALFLFAGDYKDLAPAGLPAAVEHRYVEPLLLVASELTTAVQAKEIGEGNVGNEVELITQLSILTDTLNRVPLQ